MPDTSRRGAEELDAPVHPDDENQSAPPDKSRRRRLVLFGLAMIAISLFMYVSFIVKTAVRGP